MNEPLEVRDLAIDSQELVSRLRRRIEERRQNGTLPPDLPEFVLPAVPAVSDATLRYHLERINASYDKIWVERTIGRSPVAHVPVFGRLWLLVRKHLHKLILFYVDIFAARQLVFNEHTTAALNRVASLQEENRGLSETIQSLCERIAKFEETQESGN